MLTKDIIEKDRKYIWHPCTQEKDHETLPPIPISHGEGPYLFDTEGNRYIDAVSSWWVTLFGHANQRLNRAITDQSEKIAHHIFAGFTHEPAVQLAEILAKKTPGNLTKTFFADNGSAAVEAALKMSFQYWQQTGKPEKTRFVSITDAYHGETVGALSVSGCDLYKEVYKPMLLDEFQVAGPDCYRCPYGEHRNSCKAECFESMERLVNDHHREIAGIIIEPLIQCAAGMKIYPPIYLQKLRALCDSCNVHYIADEIAVGFGRTGKLFANEHADIAPDLLCLSKGITGGYMPLSVVVTTEEVYQAFYDDYETLKAFLHSHSYTGNPLACALAVETMRIFEDEQIIEHIPERADILFKGIVPLLDHPNVGEIRNQGLVYAIELVQDRESKTPFPWQERIGYQLFKDALKKGALLRPLGNIIYFMPHLNTPHEVLTDLAQIAVETVEEFSFNK